MNFQHITIDEHNPADPHCKTVGDLDADGRVDLLVGSAAGDGVWWYRAPDWSKHQIAAGAFTTDMAVGDIDGDGFLDVVIPELNLGLFWFQNPLSEGRDPGKELWKAHNIDPVGAGMHDVELADLDGDGVLEIVTRHQSGFGKMLGNAIYIWKQVAAGRWEHRTFECTHGEGLELCDIDGDGRTDVVIGGRWYRNPGDVLAGEWEEHLFISPEVFDRGWTRGDVMVATGDLDGDGRPEIVLSPSEGQGRFSWFHAPAAPEDGPWIEHVIEETDHVHGLAVGDVDGDGSLEIVTAKMHQGTAPQEVAIYERAGERWNKKTVLSTTGSHSIRLTDIYGTGKLSVFGCNWNNNSSTHGAVELWLAQ